MANPVDPYAPISNPVIDATAAADPSVAIMRAAAADRARTLAAFNQKQALEAAQEQRTQASSQLAQAHDQHVVAQDQQTQQTHALANDLTQWSQDPANPQYRVPWDQLPAEVPQHVQSAFPGVASAAPKVWNDAYTANTGNAVQVRTPLTPAQRITAQKNNIELGPTDTLEDYVQKMADKQSAPPAPLTDEEQKMAESIARYDIPPSQAFGRGGNINRQRVLAAAADLGYDAKEYPTRLASRRDFTSGQSAKAITSLNTVMHHLGNALDAYQKVGNTGAGTWINSPINLVRSKLGGNSDVTAYETNANLVAEEMAKLLKGGMATKSEVEDWQKKLDSGLAPKQLQDNIKEMMGAIAGRVDGLRNQWESAYMRPRELPFLDEDAQNVLKKHGFDPNAIDRGSKPTTGAPGLPQTANPAPAPVAPPNEPTATNPKTGEKVVFRNGQWQPLQ